MDLRSMVAYKETKALTRIVALAAVGVGLAILLGGCADRTGDLPARIEDPSAEARTGPDGVLGLALAQPIFDTYYVCGEHREGELTYTGDALGADCLVQELEEIEGRSFARMYRGDGSRNQDWYGWGRDVLAPCAGEVTRINVNDVTNEPGVLGEPPATFVVIRRDDDVHFLLAHLTDLTVEVGDRIAAGQRLGSVGNNGYGRSPHIHIGAWHGETPLQIRFDLREEGI